MAESVGGERDVLFKIGRGEEFIEFNRVGVLVSINPHVEVAGNDELVRCGSSR